MPLSLKDRLDASAAAAEARLDAALAGAALPGERVRPERLMAAMRHGALGGGKRLRPFLVMESAALFGIPADGAVTVAAAVECIHCYSLVHDDLPAMDNDDLRRGRPTVHRAYDEATAILAGDGLLTLAFDLLAGDDAHPDPVVRVALVRALARAAGIGGMVGGQMLDLAAEGRFSGGAALALDAPAIRDLQAMKTGALLALSAEAGALLGRAGAAERAALQAYGRALGAAFQIADDILDVEGTAEEVGKKVGKDAAAGKATLVSLLGLDAARALLDGLVAEATTALGPFGARGAILAEAARFVAARRS
ncbi:polyprenyl synthetase family protein [Xanthobacter dioxanivorans]|uniref:Probable farnesyl diphosphate synthase n=1 Tax=Xanthobacter dioxanivorans TaxID=2528964 RepID=A0A974PQM1_9HYPH|nr:farnesyl diphosphate synthase [Xanthobacter dioxanivorans]QRG07937.1 polyprenyl synthetase family protein [Xanthobacter dioxanivorans]